MTQIYKKIILITGCSSGFGLLTAAHLASRGHKVIATMRDLTKNGSLLSEVNVRGGQINIWPLDVRDEKSIQDTINFIIAEYGYLDVLINNAGYGIGGFFEDLTDEDIREQMEVNFFGVQNVTRAVIPLMRPRKEGRIIFALHPLNIFFIFRWRTDLLRIFGLCDHVGYSISVNFLGTAILGRLGRAQLGDSFFKCLLAIFSCPDYRVQGQFF